MVQCPRIPAETRQSKLKSPPPVGTRLWTSSVFSEQFDTASVQQIGTCQKTGSLYGWYQQVTLSKLSSRLTAVDYSVGNNGEEGAKVGERSGFGLQTSSGKLGLR
jgi:hypothetical protein